MIKAILFDMDGTLLDINLEAYIYAYNSKRASLLSDITNRSKYSFVLPTTKAYMAIDDQNRTDSLTNEELYTRVFYKESKVPLGDPIISNLMKYFDLEMASQLNNRLINAHPRVGGFEAIKKARELGMKVALATNPSFTKEAIDVRMRWAGLSADMFDHVSHMSNSTRLKPSSRYYTETAHAIGVEPEECIMIGNDAKRDIASPGLGMNTIYVGRKNLDEALWCCDMKDLSSLLPYLIDQVNLKQRKEENKKISL